MAYDTQAQEFAYSFYSKGWSKERALPEIRKVYAGFSGSTWDEWVKKLDWPQRRALADAKLRQFDDLCRNAASELMLELNEVREKLLAVIREGKADNQTFYAFNSTVKQIADMAAKHLANQNPFTVSMDVLMGAFETFLAELQQVEGLRKPLEANAAAVGKLVSAAAERFGRA